eukprot:14396010-Alexandrium_andersonii.AAC.1
MEDINCACRAVWPSPRRPSGRPPPPRRSPGCTRGRGTQLGPSALPDSAELWSAHAPRSRGEAVTRLRP